MPKKIMQELIFDKIMESGLENASKKFEIEKNYSANLALKENSALEKYGKLKYNWQKSRFIKKLVKNEEYFSAYRVHISDFYQHKKTFNEKLIVLLADKFANTLIKENLCALLPIYTYEMYWIAGLKEDCANNRLKKLMEKNSIPVIEINGALKGNYEAIGSQRLRNEIYKQRIL